MKARVAIWYEHTVTAIWSTDPAGGWKLLTPAGFPSESVLHALVEQTPQLVPLAGSPRLVVVGKEVRLGSGYADLIGIEPSGRISVIEVKLAHSAEARRAVVSQVLAYAAYLHGMDLEDLEQQVLAPHLAGRGFSSLFSAIDDGTLDAVRFEAGVAESLATGRFRIVIQAARGIRRRGFPLSRTRSPWSGNSPPTKTKSPWRGRSPGTRRQGCSNGASSASTASTTHRLRGTDSRQARGACRLHNPPAMSLPATSRLKGRGQHHGKVTSERTMGCRH